MVDCPKVDKDTHSFVSAQGISCGVSGMQGHRSEMEDTYIITDIPGQEDHLLMAVFDGHGGGGAAIFASEMFVFILVNTDKWREYVTGDCLIEDHLQQAMAAAYLEVDVKLRVHQEASNGKDISGCTAVVCIVTPKYIVCANAGDSRCVMGTNGRAKALSEDHKPENYAEKKRIRAAGGEVFGYCINGMVAVSRGFGDFFLKDRHDLPPQDQKITCYPDVTIHPRSAEDELVLLACDGLWDVIGTDCAITTAQKSFESGHSCTEVAEKLIDIAFDGGSDDNITVVVARLQPHAKGRNEII